MGGSKWKNIALIAGVVIALSVAGVVVMFNMSAPCPVVLAPVGVGPDGGGAFEAEYDKLIFRTHASETSEVQMVAMAAHLRDREYDLSELNQPKVEVRMEGRWVAVPETLNFVFATRPTMPQPKLGFVIFLVPKGAEVCRVKLQYVSTPMKLPLGMRSARARTSPPSKASARVQRLTKTVSKRLYNWLWPREQPRQGWKTAVVEVTLTNVPPLSQHLVSDR